MIRPPRGVILVTFRQIEGAPRPDMLAQWVANESRSWWTEEALKTKGGLSLERTTACFIRRGAKGWFLKVFTDQERQEALGGRLSGGFGFNDPPPLRALGS
jgi:hypothetical protein